MSRISRRTARNPWVGAFALFAGTVAFLLLGVLSFAEISPASESAGPLGAGAVVLVQVAGTLVRWTQVGWEIRQTVLSLVPPGLIVLYVFLSLIALIVWVGLIAGVQSVLRPAGIGET